MLTNECCIDCRGELRSHPPDGRPAQDVAVSGQLPVGQVTSLQGVVTVTECRQGLGAGTSSDPLGEAEHVSRIVAELHRAKPIRCRVQGGRREQLRLLPWTVAPNRRTYESGAPPLGAVRWRIGGWAKWPISRARQLARSEPLRNPEAEVRGSSLKVRSPAQRWSMA